MLIGTRTRHVSALGALFVTTAAILLAGAGTANAGKDDPVSSVTTSSDTITVMVSGSGYRGGSAGSGGIASVSVKVPAPCWMTPWATGREYYEYVATGQMARDNHHYVENMKPLPSYADYKDDDKGNWYGAECLSSNWPNPDDTAGFNAFTLAFFSAHSDVYVQANEVPPGPPVPPELLRDVAVKNLQLPDPRLDWNPRLKEGGGTVVNLSTWFWLTGSPSTLKVQASVPGQEATVTATFEGMKISAPGEDGVSCPGPGTPYSPAAAPTCSMAFRQASVHSGASTTPVTVSTTWAATWEVNGTGHGAVDVPPVPDVTENIQVDEVQTLVIGAR